MSILEPKLDVLGAKIWWEAKSKKSGKIDPLSKAKSVLQKFSNLKFNAANFLLFASHHIFAQTSGFGSKIDMIIFTASQLSNNTHNFIFDPL